MDDIREQMDLANEISEAISQPVGLGVDFDEDELNQELEDLEQEELDAKLLDTGVDLNLPTVPTSVPGCHYINVAVAEVPRPARKQQVRDEVDDELAALQASMQMN